MQINVDEPTTVRTYRVEFKREGGDAYHSWGECYDSRRHKMFVPTVLSMYVRVSPSETFIINAKAMELSQDEYEIVVNSETYDDMRSKMSMPHWVSQLSVQAIAAVNLMENKGRDAG